jgi:hypothetical protein
MKATGMHHVYIELNAAYTSHTHTHTNEKRDEGERGEEGWGWGRERGGGGDEGRPPFRTLAYLEFSYLLFNLPSTYYPFFFFGS